MPSLPFIECKTNYFFCIAFFIYSDIYPMLNSKLFSNVRDLNSIVCHNGVAVTSNVELACSKQSGRQLSMRYWIQWPCEQTQKLFSKIAKNTDFFLHRANKQQHMSIFRYVMIGISLCCFHNSNKIYQFEYFCRIEINQFIYNNNICILFTALIGYILLCYIYITYNNMPIYYY